MPGPMGVITVEGSFKQAYYCEQDSVAQVTVLIVPCVLDGSTHDVGRASGEEATKAAAVVDRLSIGEVVKAPGGSGGSAGPSIQALGPPEGVNSIKVSFDLSP